MEKPTETLKWIPPTRDTHDVKRVSRNCRPSRYEGLCQAIENKE